MKKNDNVERVDLKKFMCDPDINVLIDEFENVVAFINYEHLHKFRDLVFPHLLDEGFECKIQDGYVLVDFKALCECFGVDAVDLVKENPECVME